MRTPSRPALLCAASIAVFFVLIVSFQPTQAQCTAAGGNLTCNDSANNTTVNSSFTGAVNMLGGSDSLTITSLGIVGDNATASTDGVILGAGSDTLVNNGTINGLIAVDAGTGNDRVTNNRHINGSVNLGTASDTLTNNSIITGNVSMGNNDSSSYDVLINQGSIGGQVIGGTPEIYAASDYIINNGTISGGMSLGNGQEYVENNTGDYIGGIGVVMGAGGGTLSNAGTIVGGMSGSGDTYLNNSNLISGNVSLSGFADDLILNSGTITGMVYLGDNDSSGPNSLYNSGHINGGLTGGVPQIYNFSDYITNAGVLSGPINLLGEADLLTNTLGGRILTDVNMGAGNDSVITVAGSTITGSVLLQSGCNSLSNAGRITGNVSGVSDTPTDCSDTFNNGGFIGGGLFAGNGSDVINNFIGGYIGGIDAGGANDTITNGSLVAGVIVAGDGNDRVTNLGGGLANYISGDNGNDSLVNGGAVNTSISGGVGQDTITNNAGAVASWLNGDGDNDIITNGGFVNADLNGGGGNDSITALAGSFAAMLIGDLGLDTITNAGFLNGTAMGGADNDRVTNLGGAQAGNLQGDDGNDSVFNGGYLVGSVFGGAGDDTVVNAAFAYASGINAGGGNDTIINGGYLNGWIDCGSGNDVVTAGGFIAGGILCGDGNDTVVVIGGGIAGVIDGGIGTDALTFSFAVTVNTQAERTAIVNALVAASPAGGTINIAGRVYSWTSFNVLYNLLTFNVLSEPVIITIPVTRRVNQSDAAAPVAVYCAADAVEAWTIGADGAGSYAFSIPYADVSAGTTVSAQGVTFTSAVGGSFSISATASDGKPYAFTGSCS